MLFDNVKGKSKRIPTPPMRPPAPRPIKPTYGEHPILPSRAKAVEDYKDNLIADVDDAINQGIGTDNPIRIDVEKYNPAVVNEVIDSLKNAGWEVDSIYSPLGFSKLITLS
ncbi:hypothetical protein LN344_06970 [Lacticaseibacillus paracasei subsp. paracasei]|uniref:hypothetical protein n=1 Tax=Lacticaseibacillus paracasei TaxID=1597 RepID=UPI001E2A94FF|nr:hypothetical protein [Lacticaseibacillus paracasei]MCD0433099.1 hypothetical protein [Lacticaseibacillus paracasei subsp. paracasei]